MLRILLVAPGLGLQTAREIRDLSSLHRVTVLGDSVTSRDVYITARDGYDVVHFATHSDENKVLLSNGEVLDDTDVLQVARIARVKLVFFNSCMAGRLAHYLVGHGVSLSIHTNVDLSDAEAWKMALAYYGAVDRLGNSNISAYVQAFKEASDGEGTYGMAISPDQIIAWDQICREHASRSVRPPLTRWQIAIMIVMVVFVGWLVFLTLLH